MHRKSGTGNVFYFKQFHIHHDRCSMKVGTDAILLGAWVSVGTASRILDIGTGSGVIALMLAQRSSPHVSIVGIEPDIDSYEQATENIAQSVWANQIEIFSNSLQDFGTSARFDLIVSNPPFFSDSLRPVVSPRKNARHTDTLSHEELLNAAARLLSDSGRFCLILPMSEGERFINHAASAALHCSRVCNVRTRPHKPIERLLLEFSKQKSNRSEEVLLLENRDGSRTSEYNGLIGNFYLDKSPI